MDSNYNFYIDAYNLHIILNRNIESIAELTDSGLSYGQYVILKYIADKKDGKVSQKELDHSGCIRRSTLSQHLKSLCRRGYIRHEFLKEDNRSKEISVTQKAVDVLKAMDREISQTLEEKVGGEEQIKYHQLLEKMKVSV